MGDPFRINIRGTAFLSSSSLLRDLVDNLVKSDCAILQQNGEFFIDRNPLIFHHVLDYYSGNDFHLPRNICPVQAQKEVEFWKIPSKNIPTCCYEVLYSDTETQYSSIENFESDLKTQALQTVSPMIGETKITNPFKRLRYRLLEAHTHPFSTWTGRIWISTSAVLTITSVVVYLLNSDNHFRIPREDLPVLPYNLTYDQILENRKFLDLVLTVREPVKSAIEISANIFLLLELVLNFIITHQKRKFLCSIQNIVEALAGAAAFLVLYFDLYGGRMLNDERFDDILSVIGVLQGLRVIRVLRLVESTPGMKVLKLSLRKSWREFALLIMVLTSFSLVFGSTIYWIELDQQDTFPNIFVSIWWALVTMTTVGYGDFYPKTTGGYFVAIFAAVLGLLLIAMPITILASNFNAFYNCYNYRKRHLLRKK